MRVIPGTERKQVQRMINRVLPMVSSADEYGRGGKHLVVPGYVFTSFVPATGTWYQWQVSLDAATGDVTISTVKDDGSIKG